MEELKPCPFCGGEAHVVHGVYRDGGYIEHAAYVQCAKCGARTDEVSECMPEMRVHDMAVSIWNRRAERTCRMGAPVDGEYRCSECGHLNRETYRPDRGWYQPEYCAHCGAKVVER